MRISKRSHLVGIDGEAAVKEAVKLLSRRIEQPARRAFLQRSLTLGGLAMLGGCSITDNAGVETALETISRFNDRVHGWLTGLSPVAPFGRPSGAGKR
jgi:hypothetical protein